MDVPMFYSPVGTLIRSLISSVAHLTLKHSLPLIWRSQLSSPPGCQRQTWRWLTGSMCRRCVCVCVVFLRCVSKVACYNPFEFALVVGCLHVWTLMCVTGANSYVRSEVAPSHLGSGVCGGLRWLSKPRGEHLLLPLHEPRTPTPLDLISLGANSRPSRQLGKKCGAVLAHVGRMFLVMRSSEYVVHLLLGQL